MVRSLLNPIRALLEQVGRLLARWGWIDAGRGDAIAELAWPRIVTGIARMSKATADVAMVGMAVGAAGIAGIGYGVPYWTLAYMLGGGIAGGTISVVSQRFGAGEHPGITTAVAQSAGFGLLTTLPLVALFTGVTEPLIRLIGSGEEAVAHGVTYLSIASWAMPFAALNLVGSRALVGANEAWIPMVIRAGGAVANVILSGVLIFGFDLGVAGAALGTVLGGASVTVVLAWGFVRGRLPYVGDLPIQWDARAVLSDRATARRLVQVGTPLALRKVAQGGGRFPMMAIVAFFGPNVVAAYVVALRMRGLMNTPGWGFGLASSSLVGQALGRNDESDAEAYSHDALRFTVTVYVLVAVAILVGARPVSYLFVQDPELIPTTAALLRATCVSVVFHGLLNGALGPLRAGGDTTWPFYGQLAGLFLFALPLAYAGAVTSLGLWGVYLALVFETAVPAFVTYYRYHSRAWLAINRAYRAAQGSV